MTTWAVTGATGFVGRALVRRLGEEGVEVRAVMRPGSPSDVPQGVIPVVTSLDDDDGLARAVDGADVVLHLASPRRTRAAGGRGRVTRPGSFDLLVTATEKLLRASARSGVGRLLLSSSTAVYGRLWSTADEDTPPDPITPYQRSRLQGEVVARRIAEEVGIELTVLRLSETIGPGNRGHVDFLRSIARGGFRVPGDGSHPHQIGFLDDVVTALCAAGSRREAANQTLLVSSPEMTFREFCECVGAATGGRVRFVRALGPPARWLLRTAGRAGVSTAGGVLATLDYQLRPRSYRLDRSLEALGAYHRSTLQQAVEETVRWALEEH